MGLLVSNHDWTYQKNHLTLTTTYCTIDLEDMNSREHPLYQSFFNYYEFLEFNGVPTISYYFQNC